jgi:multidrug efflux system membrane fusion protein
MRALQSYGVAGVILLLIALWLATGTFVAGGNGPGEGERPIVSLFEEEDGPMSTAIHDAGLAPAHAEAGEHIDPHLTIAERVAQAGGEETIARSVRTQTFTLQPLAIEAPLRGRTKAKSIVSVFPETAGTVTEVHVEKGETVAKGDQLCTIDRGTRMAGVEQANAALLQAQAALDQAQQQFDTNKELRDAGLAPANSAAQFESALKAAQAGVAAAQSAADNAKAEWDRTDVVASVAGVVQDPLATVGSMLGPQAPCATIVELDPMLFVGTVPEARIGLARTGLTASITTVAGQTVDGKVSYISATADPATRSFPVEIEIANADGKIRDGLTASAIVNLGTAPAHLLPQSVLTLDDDGVLGIRAVENDIVVFYPVTIVKDTREGIWVTGLPPAVDVITVGQDFVQPGQKVNATNVADAPAEEPAPVAAPAESAHS